MNYQESLDKLFSLHQFGIKLGLDNITKLLAHIGNPHTKLKTIHIAGSNGKGSTASFISSILQECGYKVGLYTSPHFINFNERIRVEGVMISNTYVVQFMNKNIDYINSESPTFFELTTAMAFQYFVDAGVDYAVIETGLGGRLDATNVLNSLASVITSISFEHTNILGNNLATIAKEKAGIIKKNQKVFIGKIDEIAKEVLIAISIERKSSLFELEKYLHLEDGAAKLSFNGKQLLIENLPLAGKYQLYNASLAALVVQELFPSIEVEKLNLGLQNVVNNSGIEGRYERYSHNPSVIFDAAHNTEGIEAFINEYKKECGKYSHRNLIYGAMKDKNVEEILLKLNQYFDTIFVTEIDYERALTLAEFSKLGKKIGVVIKPLQIPSKFIREFISKKNNDSLVVLGSIYILGEIKKDLLLLNT
ncbi:MAG: bifunctional folylpolyglutamate synthase/dihydrofolate synthase [Melioribacteraceae bacterium]|nr:bifunctional folylpolyglutamate synthase/dihydrofolate synthase [Melioribacteraceae bacterium]